MAYKPSRFIARKSAETHCNLKEQAMAFLSEHTRPADFVDDEIHAELVRTLIEDGLVQFGCALRSSISRLRPGADSSVFWSLVDAIGFWEDAKPGRWPYMTNERAEVLLSWARSYTAGCHFIGNQNIAA